MKTAGKLFVVISLVLFVLSVSSLVSSLEPAVAAARNEASGAAHGTTEDVSPQEPLTDSDTYEERESYKYILKSEDGKVMLYAAGSELSPKELNIPYLDLPPEDRALLDSGITIKNEQQLLSVIEDYTS